MRIGKCLAVVATVVLAGCQATVVPLTDAERTEIVDTMTRLAASIDQKVDRATCEAKLSVFSGRSPWWQPSDGSFVRRKT